MASLHSFRAGQVRPKAYQIYKAITVIGQGADADLTLAEPALSDGELRLLFDGQAWTLEGTGDVRDFIHNGKKRRRQILADGDVLRIGAAVLIFSMTDLEANASEAAQNGQRPQDGDREDSLRYLSKLAELSVETMSEPHIDRVLQILVDGLIDLLGASKGFLILTESEKPWVSVARNMEQQDIPDEESAYSDSILRAVIESGEPVIVSDALKDRRFSGATSIMSMKLSSVLAAPLVFKGQVLGLLYLGNDNVVNLFTKQDLELLRVFAAQAAAFLSNALLRKELAERVDDLSTRVSAESFGDMIGSCPSMQRVYQRVAKVAPTDVSVLIQGETGSGKELIARELHRRGNRIDGPFVAINCGAIPENLLESELFGHVRGAFTGAVQSQPGKFQMAGGGTLFLDEIGELPLNLQVKLLRVLQEKQVVRVGATKPENVDIRVVAATNKNLAKEVEHGAFREDLYYRLNVILVSLPPLRDRGDDVLLIAETFLKRFAAEYKAALTGFDASAIRGLRLYHWPGNIRELENKIKRATIFAEGPLVSADDLELDGEAVPLVQALATVRENFQMAYVLRVLDVNAGNRTKTARDLDVDPRTIFRYLEREREGGIPDLSWMRFFS